MLPGNGARQPFDSPYGLAQGILPELVEGGSLTTCLAEALAKAGALNRTSWPDGLFKVPQEKDRSANGYSERSASETRGLAGNPPTSHKWDFGVVKEKK